MLYIHSLALNAHLAAVSHILLTYLSHPTPTYVARYLLALHHTAPPQDVLGRCLRHAVFASLPFVYALERIFAERVALGHEPPGAKLALAELPKRLFRSLQWRGPSNPPGLAYSSPTSYDASLPDPTLPPTLLPLLEHLFATYRPSASSHRGYPLCGSLTFDPLSRPLTKFLLRQGADPSLNDGYAVSLAVKRRDLALVQLLVERAPDEGGARGEGSKKERSEDDNDEGSRPVTKRLKTGISANKDSAVTKEISTTSPKRRKREDRVPVTSKMRA